MCAPTPYQARCGPAATQSNAHRDLSRGRYDVAIRVTDHELPEGTHVTPLFAERFGPVLAPALAERLALRAPADLARAPRLWARTRPNAWADWCARSGCTALEGGAPYEHFYFLLEAASAGLGVAIAPEPHVACGGAADRALRLSTFRAFICGPAPRGGAEKGACFLRLDRQ